MNADQAIQMLLTQVDGLEKRIYTLEKMASDAITAGLNTDGTAVVAETSAIERERRVAAIELALEVLQREKDVTDRYECQKSRAETH